jgi:PKD repeat protein
VIRRQPSLFDGSASFDPDGVIVGYEWDFGDGTNATGATITHSYPDKGTFQVTLTVTDDGGLTDTDVLIVIVVGE